MLSELSLLRETTVWCTSNLVKKTVVFLFVKLIKKCSYTNDADRARAFTEEKKRRKTPPPAGWYQGHLLADIRSTRYGSSGTTDIIVIRLVQYSGSAVIPAAKSFKKNLD